jgi:CHAT domain-containing protein
MKMEINSYLVVLSACKTAYSSVMEGEGMLGLTRAFFSAGVPSVVASLWSVEDNSTSELMVNFHDRVRKGRMPTNALREAQLYLLRETEFKNPFFWAPFVLIGNPGH